MARAELEVGPGADGARAARRLVSDALRKLPAELVADAEIVVTELVTNAMLHAAPPISVRVSGRRDRVRIEVRDCGRDVPLRLQRSQEGMTGRGIAVVESLSTAWGVEQSGNGKLVWAELGKPRRRVARASADGPDAIRVAWSAQDTTRRYEVHLGFVPTELLVAAKAHIDNIVRELELIRAGADAEIGLPSKTVDMLLRATERFSEARNEIKRQAVDAARRGDAFTDLTLHLPVSAANAGLHYLMALDEADRQARAARLLTVAATPSHRVFREWYVRALAEQLVAASHNQPRPPLKPFSLALAAEFDRLGTVADAGGGGSDEVYYRYADGPE
ncbi:MAG TPA: ATP-binding protein [Mycobacteriales bacterium]|nr:ATP-binding protein [Mycobacteriales bacterium]